LSNCCTSTWTNAPVSCCGSHGAVVSQARRRITASPTRTAWPGFIVTSRVSPLRLLSTPSTATRSAIGVAPCSVSVPRGVSMVTTPGVLAPVA
jgi:hypothetical protein